MISQSSATTFLAASLRPHHSFNMAPAAQLVESAMSSLFRTSRNRIGTPSRPAIAALSTPTTSRHPSLLPVRHFSQFPQSFAQTTGNSLFSLASATGVGSSPTSYFQRQSLPANTIIRFVPQQTAWIVERMGKFHKILQPGFAILIPFLDRIAYVKSLKEAAIEIPSQSAITADNVTLELDGVLYTRVFDAYKARYGVVFLVMF